MTNHHLAATIGNPQWLLAHEGALRSILPQTWTDVSSFNFLPFGYKLKLMGVPWRSMEDLQKMITFFTRIDLLEQQGNEVRVNTTPLRFK